MTTHASASGVLLREVLRGQHSASSVEALRSHVRFDRCHQLVVVGMTRVTAEAFLAAHDAADPHGETWSENWWGPGDA